MTIGEISDNLLTNQSLIGKTYAEISNSTVLKVEFSNAYVGKLNPERVRVKIIQKKQTFDATGEISNHNLGILEGSRFNVGWKIENDSLVAISPQVENVRQITEIFDFQLEELQVSDKVYTDFRLIQ